MSSLNTCFVLDYPHGKDTSVHNWASSVGLHTTDFSKADVLIIPGSGSDVDTALYHEPNTAARNSESSRKYDHEAIKLIEKAISQGKKIVGICKGLQLLHVAMGGKLIQDHWWDRGTHDVNYVDDTMTNGLFARVMASHHQAVDPNTIDVTKGQLIAWGDDESQVEGMYYPLANAVGVQFHPEWNMRKDINDFIFSQFKKESV